MAFKPKVLTEEQIVSIRNSAQGHQKLARQFGVSTNRISLIKKAESLDKALELVKEKPQKGEPQAPERRESGLSKESFTPIGIPTDTKKPEWITIGTMRMPYEDWGWSSNLALLVVAQTYEDWKRIHPFEGKIGDFCACLCQAFRYQAGWDIIGEGLQEPVKVTIESGGEHEQQPGGAIIKRDGSGNDETSRKLE